MQLHPARCLLLLALCVFLCVEGRISHYIHHTDAIPAAYSRYSPQSQQQAAWNLMFWPYAAPRAPIPTQSTAQSSGVTNEEQITPPPPEERQYYDGNLVGPTDEMIQQASPVTSAYATMSSLEQPLPQQPRRDAVFVGSGNDACSRCAYMCRSRGTAIKRCGAGCLCY